MEAKIITIHPRDAKLLLENNTNNRTISESHVKRLATDMRDGNFRLNGDAIRIRHDGVLLDGQHRLLACVKSGKPFQTLYVTGLEEEDMLTIDMNRKRNAGDALRIMEGVPNGRSVTSALRILAVIARSEIGAQLTTTEMRNLYLTHPKIEESVSKCLSKHVAPGVPSYLSAIHYIGTMHQERPERADAFVNVFRTGIPDYEGCAAHRLREFLLKKKLTKSNPTPAFSASIHVATWLNFVNQNPVKLVRAKDEIRIPFWDEERLWTPFET